MLLSTLGDSGYAQQPWLFVPLPEPQTLAEKNFNKVHRSIGIGVLKSRFRCLCRQRILMYGTARAANIIIACAVLHNIMVQSKYHEPLEAEIEWNIAGEIQDSADDEGDIAMDANIIRVTGCEARSRLIRESF